MNRKIRSWEGFENENSSLLSRVGWLILLGILELGPIINKHRKLASYIAVTVVTVLATAWMINRNIPWFMIGTFGIAAFLIWFFRKVTPEEPG